MTPVVNPCGKGLGFLPRAQYDAALRAHHAEGFGDRHFFGGTGSDHGVGYVVGEMQSLRRPALNKNAGAVKPGVKRPPPRGFDLGSFRELHVEHQLALAGEGEGQVAIAVAGQRADAFRDADLLEQRLRARRVG